MELYVFSCKECGFIYLEPFDCGYVFPQCPDCDSNNVEVYDGELTEDMQKEIDDYVKEYSITE